MITKNHFSSRKSENKIWYFYRAFIWLLEEDDLDNFLTSTILAKVSLLLEGQGFPGRDGRRPRRPWGRPRTRTARTSTSCGGLIKGTLSSVSDRKVILTRNLKKRKDLDMKLSIMVSIWFTPIPFSIMTI